MSPACDHLDLAAAVDIGRLTKTEGGPVVGYVADITVECAACGERFRWNCSTVGALAGEPTRSVDGFELRAPLRPASADDDFGRGLPGFRLNVRHHG